MKTLNLFVKLSSKLPSNSPPNYWSPPPPPQMNDGIHWNIEFVCKVSELFRKWRQKNDLKKNWSELQQQWNVAMKAP